MKRTLTILGAALAATVLAAGPAAAGEHHGSSTHHDGTTCATKCRPAPLPKPPGGWPCAKDHSCSTKHHHPICPPKPPHTKPPGTGDHGHNGHHPKPKPPVVVAHPVPPIVHDAPKTPASAIPQLPRTGPVGDVVTLGGMGLGAIALGVVPFVLTRRPKAVTDAIRGEL